MRGRARRGMLAAAALGLALAALAGCSKQVTPPSVGPSTTSDPAVMPQARLLVADRSLTVYWTVGDTTRVSQYRVYRSKQASGGYTQLGSTAARTWIDGNVQPGVTYYYQVASLLKDGNLSQPSTAVSGVPSLFSISINGGLPRTRSLSLSLQLSAPTGTSYMQLSESSGFAGTAWENFSITRTYTLLPGDGPRTIWARFRDRDGNESSPISHAIILDTQAFTDSLGVSPAGGVLAPGAVVHFRLRTRGAETEGTASVDVGARMVGIPLTDQGVNGDTRAGDGIYELDYTLSRGADVLRVPVTGHFFDAAGNKAPDLTADSLFTLHTPPTRVTLVSVVPTPDETSSNLDLTWTPNNEAGFASYQVFRADAVGTTPPAGSAAYSRLTTITSRGTVTYTDASAREGRSYAYRVDVVDSLAYAATGSPVVAAARSQGAVTLGQPVAGQGPDSLNVILNWTQSNDALFSSYQVLRAEAADTLTQPGETAFLLINTITGKTTLNYTDVAPRENIAFWYRLDELGNTGIRHLSRARPYLTLNAAPPAVTLAPPFEVVAGRVSLSWSRSTARDFAYYRTYRAQGSSADTSLATLVFRSDATTALTAIDTVELQSNTAYWYRTWVTDTRGLATGSTEQSFTTKSQPPPPVTLSSASPVSRGVSLAWTRSHAQDFESYRVYRALDASVSNGSALVGTIPDSTTTMFSEFFGQRTGADSLKANTDYYYRVYVYNKSNLSAGSNTASVHTPAWSQAPVRPAAHKPRPPATGARP
jgi:fibronectin type 3 domain-containing protein